MIPGEYLLGEGDISIKMLENHWVAIRSGRSNTKMVGMARANFPALPNFPKPVTTPGSTEPRLRGSRFASLPNRIWRRPSITQGAETHCFCPPAILST